MLKSCTRISFFLLSAMFMIASSPSAYALAFANTIAVDVGNNPDDQSNYPLVTIQICAPDTQICQIIPNVFLDTGSTGLRIKTSALRADLLAALPTRKSITGNEIAECYEYDDSDDWWGSIGVADVKFGDEIASNISIQLVDPSFKTAPSECSGNVAGVAREKINGMLGVNFVRSDCDDHDCSGDTTTTSHYGMAYYSCDANGKCTDYAMPMNMEVINPVYAFGKDSNGYILELPAIASEGSMDSHGTLTFGIETRDNNQVDPDSSNIALKKDGSTFPLTLNGMKMTGFFDSGTAAYAVPAKKLSIPLCSDQSGYLCPATTVDLTLNYHDVNEKLGTFKISIANGMAEDSSQFFAFDDSGIDLLDGYPNEVFLGLPFFFGRKVYFGFNNSPLGKGEHVSIAPATSEAAQ